MPIRLHLGHNLDRWTLHALTGSFPKVYRKVVCVYDREISFELVTYG